MRCQRGYRRDVRRLARCPRRRWPAVGERVLPRVAEGAKTLQFGLARVISGRRFDVQATLGEMADAWDGAMDVLGERYGG